MIPPTKLLAWNVQHHRQGVGGGSRASWVTNNNQQQTEWLILFKKFRKDLVSWTSRHNIASNPIQRQQEIIHWNFLQLPGATTYHYLWLWWKSCGGLISVQLWPFLYSRLGSCYYTYVLKYCQSDMKKQQVQKLQHSIAHRPKPSAPLTTLLHSSCCCLIRDPFLYYCRAKVMTDCINVPSARNFELGKENKCWSGI
jgi:hypothetical protein